VRKAIGDVATSKFLPLPKPWVWVMRRQVVEALATVTRPGRYFD
jgi:hypothetical protein